MKQIIARRNKKTYFYLLLLSILTLIASRIYMNISFMKYVAIPTIVIVSLASVIWLFYLIDPRGVIERHDDTIVVLNGFSKIKINLCDILDVCYIEKQNKPQKYQKNAIKIIAMVNQQQTDIICGDVINEKEAIQTLLSIINK